MERITDDYFKQTYPLDFSVAIDGNITFSEDCLMRFEMAYSRDRTYSSFQDGRIGRKFVSDQYNLLLGTDKTFNNQLYFNIQALLSHVPDMRVETPFQLKPTEYMTSIQLRKGFRNETLFVEFNGISNLSTGEFILTPQATLQQTDYLKLVGGMHINGRSTDALGPIGQFDKNNTAFFETHVVF